MTLEGDVVLVYMEGKPAFFARIEDITGDVKPEWFQVKMLVLQVPLVMVTWILREAYINGEEFTMGGRPIRMEKVVAPDAPSAEEEPEKPAAERQEKPGASAPATHSSKVVSLFDKRNKDQSS